MFTARYELSPYIKQIRLVFKVLWRVSDDELLCGKMDMHTYVRSYRVSFPKSGVSKLSVR